LSDDREAVGAQGIPLTPGRSIAIDRSLHVYGTPFFLQARLPLTTENQSTRFDRLMIAQDTGSAIVGPARADIFWGAGEEAGRLAGGLHHPATFAMLVPREVNPVAAGARMPLPPEKPPLAAEANARTSLPKPATLVQGRRFSQANEFGRNLRPQSRQQSGCSDTSGLGRNRAFRRTEPNHHVRSASPVTAGADCGPSAKAAQTKEVAKRVFPGFAPSTELKWWRW